MRHLSTLIFIVFPWVLCAQEIQVDGIYYGIVGTRTAYVTHPGMWATDTEQWPTVYEGDLTIPSSITYNGRTYSVRSIGESAFAGCDALTSVQLPSSVTAISACAFLGCESLRHIDVPDGLLSVNDCAFTGCTSLREISLPRHAYRVDSLAFYCCASLSSIVLPHTIEKVCHGALQHLPKITDLYCFASVPPVAEQEAFTMSDQQHCTLHVPVETLHSYQQTSSWSNFKEFVPITDQEYLDQGYLRGDVNDDGKVDADDLRLLQRLIVSIRDKQAVNWCADVNGDGKVNAVDYVILANSLQSASQ